MIDLPTVAYQDRSNGHVICPMCRNEIGHDADNAFTSLAATEIVTTEHCERCGRALLPAVVKIEKVNVEAEPPEEDTPLAMKYNKEHKH